MLCTFDKETFEEKQYAPGKNYSYEANGFGDICYSMDELTAKLLDLKANNNTMEDKYSKRVDGYFEFFDHDNRERIFHAIVDLIK